jgi:hypothetical protein
MSPLIWIQPANHGGLFFCPRDLRHGNPMSAGAFRSRHPQTKKPGAFQCRAFFVDFPLWPL